MDMTPLFLLLAAPLWAAGPATPAPMTPLELKEKLSLLASESWETREAASARLGEAYDERVETVLRSRWALQAFGADMKDAEVVSRVEQLRFEGRAAWLKARLSKDCLENFGARRAERLAADSGMDLLIALKDRIWSTAGCEPADVRAMVALVRRRLAREQDEDLAAVGAALAKDTDELADLEPFLTCPYPKARREAVAALRRLEFSPAVSAALRRGAQDPDAQTAVAAMDAAQFLEDPAVKASIAAEGLSHAAAEARGRALHHLGALKTGASGEFDKLAAFLKSERAEGSSYACQVVGEISPDERGAALLGECVAKAPSARVRQAAMEALIFMARSGSSTREAALTQLPAVEKAGQDDPDPSVRSWCAHGARCMKDGRGLHSGSRGVGPRCGREDD